MKAAFLFLRSPTNLAKRRVALFEMHMRTGKKKNRKNVAFLHRLGGQHTLVSTGATAHMREAVTLVLSVSTTTLFVSFNKCQREEEEK